MIRSVGVCPPSRRSKGPTNELRFSSELVGVCPHNCFDMIHEIIEGDECKLGFEVCEFAQMAASVTWVE